MITDLLVRLKNMDSGSKDPRFYFVWHKRLFNLLFILIIVNFLVWGGGVYLSISRPEAYIYAQTTEGKTVTLYSVEEPKYSNRVIEEWAEKVIKLVYNYDFSRYEEQLVRARKYFAPETWTLFVDSLEENILPNVKSKQLQVSVAVDKAKIGSPPLVIGGIATWNVKIPALISYVSASETKTRKVELDVIVKRQVSFTNPEGLWITRITESNK